MAEQFSIRAATPDDAEAVTALLSASYPALLAPGYEPEVLARALPLMTRANPALLRSGTYYLALSAQADTIGCGGWTLQRPGAPSAPIDRQLGHIRHFGTHPRWQRRGIGRALMDRCVREARAAGLARLECYSTLVAERYYQALGFTTVEPITVTLGEGIDFPSLRMIRSLAD
jgi:GNAT superfamily N-acetyltransferase